MKRQLAIILVAITALSLVGCGKKEPVKQEEKSIAVTVQAAIEGEIKNTNTFTGTTRVKDETDVSPEIGGTIEKTYFEVGQKVHKGDVLLKIKGDDVQDGVKTAQATLDSSKASTENNIEKTKIQYKNALDTAQLNYDEAKRNYDIQTELYKADAISEEAYKGHEKTYNSAKQALDKAVKDFNEVLPKEIESLQKSTESAQAGLDVASRKIDKLTLVSPVDGTITAKKCNDNETAAQGTPAYTISNPNVLQVDLKVTNNDLNKFKVGDEVKVTVGDKSTTGTIKTVPDVVDSTTSLYTVEVIINNGDGKFKAGASAEVEVSIEQENNAVNVPKKAILEENNKKYVYIVTKDKKAKKVEVTTGIETAEKIEIKSGVSNSDTIVIGGLSLIADGTKLFPVEKKED